LIVGLPREAIDAHRYARRILLGNPDPAQRA